MSLPRLDTLFLSPICFPQNPYHRLVKDYKLVPESITDPVSDARQSAVLLTDEVEALRGINRAAPEIFSCLRFLLCREFEFDSCLAQGMQKAFQAAGAKGDLIPSEEALAKLRGNIGGRGCFSAAAGLQESDFTGDSKRWTMAYALTWLRVAGSDSVLPPWVRLRHPRIIDLLKRLRDIPCDHPDCAYCREVHNPEIQLNRYFSYSGFRETPVNRQGKSLQRDMVVAGMRNESLLAILPTGGGKSICFQLPALLRGYRRGQLTIVLSPLQALMKDQVDGLVRRTGMNSAAALYGMLTGPERGDVLHGIRMGRICLVYVSPEQLRSVSFKNAIKQREIGCWVLDEAHCLSKWGHDFRPDYLYAGRFIREMAEHHGGCMPPIACYSATAKNDVKQEILDYFRSELGMELALYEGGVERDNLHFEVRTVKSHGKLPMIHDLLVAKLSPGGPGSAIVFRSTRKNAEITAEYLRRQDMQAAFFHAGLLPTEKKRVQNDFLSGELQVICATNAFGMGIDKDDVRLVIHGEVPGSLENYQQEAGRAGRDQRPADCVLLYDEDDCEQQFRLGAFSELSRRDIAQILRGLRKMSKVRRSDEVVITTGELLRDQDVDIGFDIMDNAADTKVRTAVSWLERAGFVERNENRTNLIQARLLVRSAAEAAARLDQMSLSAQEKSLWLAIVRQMINASEMDMLSVDELTMLPEFQSYLQHRHEDTPEQQVKEGRSVEYLSSKVLKILDAMMGVGLLKKDTMLTAYISYKVANNSQRRLERVLDADRECIEILSGEEPDPEGWLHLNLCLLNDAMRERDIPCSIEMLLRILQSLEEDGRGFGGGKGSISARHVGRNAYRVKLNRDWNAVKELSERRRQIAHVLLDAIINTVPTQTAPRADLLVDFTFEQLRSALEQDLALRSEIKDMQAAIERGLMFLHEQQSLTIQRGLAIFRSAMTVKVLPESMDQRYGKDHYISLQNHYKERIFQVHVMNEYAKHGLQKIAAALDLVMAYFTMGKEEFIKQYFGKASARLENATTSKSYRNIVESLGNPDQSRIVLHPVNRNLLILAGPGSGKTLTVVHRCAYLLRVKRVRPRSVLICCFNHKAALELRRRLANLVGQDAVGVTIQTYHGLALRILGMSFSRMAQNNEETVDFDRLIKDAVETLRGEREIPGVEPDEVREKLLAGFEYILVDEYQDIDEPQYDMIGAIAGKTQHEADSRLTIMAVGDDDQSIYAFRGANVNFIRRFRQDYNAQVSYLIDNYRSTAYIIEAANRLIARNRDRMKTDREIRIDKGRRMQPAGGINGVKDQLNRGRIAIVEVPDIFSQADGVVREITRLRAVHTPSAWNEIAVLSRTREDLSLIRTAAEKAGIPVSWPMEPGKFPQLYRIREISSFLHWLKARRAENITASAMMAEAKTGRNGQADRCQWTELLGRLLEAWKLETGDAPVPVRECIEFMYGSLTQRHREEYYGEGVVLSTIHGAKGMEYPHVILCGKWSAARSRREEEEKRRILYVGMIRAKESLSIFKRMDCRASVLDDFAGSCFVHRRETQTSLTKNDGREYRLLGLDDIFLDFAGRKEARHPVHAALRKLRSGNELQIKQAETRIALLAPEGGAVAQLSNSGVNKWGPQLARVDKVRIVCLIERTSAESKEEQYSSRLRVENWLIPLCEVIARPRLPEHAKAT